MSRDIVTLQPSALGPTVTALRPRYALLPNRRNRSWVYSQSEVKARCAAVASLPGCPDLARLALAAVATATSGAGMILAQELADVLNSLRPAGDLRRPDALTWQAALDRLAIGFGLEVRP